jgi:hypothetical protein
MPRRREPPPFGEYRIICPYCKFQNPQVTRDDYNVFQCPSCYGDFRVFIAKVRAKRGRSDGYREYMIRTVTHSGESVLRFRDFGCSDLDLRSGDIFYVCHKKDENGIFESEPSILSNITTHQYTEIVHPQPPQPIKTRCFIATVTCGYHSSEVETLSSFRDKVLLESRTGWLIVGLYYRFSPFLAYYVADKENLKRSMRRFLVSPITSLVSRLFRKSLSSDRKRVQD